MPISPAVNPGFERAGRADDEAGFHRIEFASFLIFHLVRRHTDRASNLFFLFASRADAGRASKMSGHCQCRRDDLHLLMPSEPQAFLDANIAMSATNPVA
jgi:hypothetical protein